MKSFNPNMMSNQFKDVEEYAYHLEQLKSYMENQIVWESRQEDIRRSKLYARVFYGPQRNPNEPLRTPWCIKGGPDRNISMEILIGSMEILIGLADCDKFQRFVKRYYVKS
ncbi:hypothetical protein Tco_1376831 [Tanacetum coccineum]